MEFSNSERQVINTSQKIYDSFNDFIFSDDKKVLSKLIARAMLIEKTRDIPGDIVECGVFKGSGILSFLKIKSILSPNSFKKVIGFDMFNNADLVNDLHGIDKETMDELFKSRNFKHENGYELILAEIIKQAGYDESRFELIKGDISKTSNEYVTNRPGAKISILYLDMDLAKPTYDALVSFWDRITIGGLVVFDEYAYHQWSESAGVDRFLNERKLKIKSLDFQAPTAYIEKTH
jgi:hypothetical protein